jgi:hypothetical protein
MVTHAVGPIKLKALIRSLGGLSVEPVARFGVIPPHGQVSRPAPTAIPCPMDKVTSRARALMVLNMVALEGA